MLRIEALAASTVKIAGRDVLATWKVLISLGVTPFLYAFYAILATIVSMKANAPPRWRLWTPFIVIAALPCIGFAALKFGEAGMDVLKYVFDNACEAFLLIDSVLKSDLSDPWWYLCSLVNNDY